MTAIIGQFVHSVKPTMFSDNPSRFATIVSMADTLPAKVFNDRLRDRLQKAREAAGLSQKTMAEKLGVSDSTYAKYENREKSKLPPHLFPRVCEVLKMDCWFLLTGRFRQEHLDPVPPEDGEKRLPLPQRRSSNSR